MIPFPLYNKPKNEEVAEFKLHSDFVPSGDQPQAIAELVQGLKKGKKNQVLLGITGSGKTFTMAKIIEKMKKPALILAHNKTLAAQLYGEMKGFFPENAVEYFVSYYDYYQPEAYIPKTDKYIEKDSAINEQIDRMRHSATRNILERRDVIIVSSVSCIYGLGDVEAYSSMVLSIKKGQSFEIDEIKKILVSMQYKRNDVAFERGTFRVMGDVVDIFPAHYEEQGWRISFFGDEVENIYEIDVLTGHKNMELSEITIYPASHFVTPRPALSKAIKTIRLELEEQINFFKDKELFLEAQRIEQRTRYDLEMMETLGMCKGIENYSRHLTGRSAGSPPPTLFEYLPEDALLFVDESHVTLPQIRAMYKGDASRKNTLTEYGFRLPSCRDNRPLKFEEWDEMRPKTIFVSATPGAWELEQTQGIFTEQIIRPTGLLDPECFVRPVALQVEDLMQECIIASQKNQCVLVTTLTKKMAEYLTDYLLEHGLKVRYMHSDIDTLERVNIIRDLRLGKFNVLVGINLLREGLDIPECALVAILDADKESFLRSSTSLIQTIGRAARNPEGRVILYADHITKSMKIALDETSARRQKQMIFNQEHHIIPKAIKKEVPDILKELGALDNDLSSCCQEEKLIENIDKKVKDLKKQMIKFAENLEFEKAAYIRDQIKKMRENELKL